MESTNDFLRETLEEYVKDSLRESFMESLNAYLKESSKEYLNGILFLKGILMGRLKGILGHP